MNVPALRFKDGEGMEFPKWEAKKISDFVLSHKGGAPLKPSDFVKEGNFEVIPKKAISSGGYLKLDEIEPTYCSEMFFQTNQRSVVDKTFLITTLRDLVPSGPSIGYIVKYINNKKYILAQGVYGIQINEKLLDDFLIQYSNTDKYRELMQTMMVGSTQVHIRNTDFFSTPFSVPSLKEQTKIANFLTAVDEKITQLTQKHNLLTQYKKGVMQQIFSQELRFKDDDGQDFPEWENKSIKELTEVVVGGTPSTTNPDFWQAGTVPWISSGELKNGIIKAPIKYITELALKKSSAKLMPKNTTVLAMTGATLGKVGYLEFDTAGNQSVAGFLPNEKFCSKFLFYVLLNDKNQVLTLAGGGAQQGINKGNIESLEFIFPTCAEQTKIANFLTVIDEKITATQTQLQAIKQYKQGLLQQMFV